MNAFECMDLKTLKATQNAVYFNILPNVVLHYPESQVLPLAIVTSILFVAVVWLGFRARTLTEIFGIQASPFTATFDFRYTS
jgi:hypothetical protein